MPEMPARDMSLQSATTTLVLDRRLCHSAEDEMLIGPAIFTCARLGVLGQLAVCDGDDGDNLVSG
jgi:hypothetical protein